MDLAELCIIRTQISCPVGPSAGGEGVKNEKNSGIDLLRPLTLHVFHLDITKNEDSYFDPNSQKVKGDCWWFGELMPLCRPSVFFLKYFATGKMICVEQRSLCPLLKPKQEPFVSTGPLFYPSMSLVDFFSGLLQNICGAEQVKMSPASLRAGSMAERAAFCPGSFIGDWQ